MGGYNILEDYGIKDGDSADISVSPYWLVMVVRYAEPLTSSKTRLAKRTFYNTGDVAMDDDTDALNRTKKPIFITSDCISLDIDSSKSRYTQTLQAALKPGRINYLSEIMPGDWVFAWMMNNKSVFKDVIKRLRAGSSANDFGDGLKFIGKVQDIRKMLAQTADGIRTVQYNLQCTGFGELDSSVFFDPNLSKNEQYIERILQHLSIPMSDIFNTAAEEAQKAGGMDINKILPALLKAFIGEGIQGLAVANGGLNLATGAGVSTKDAPFAYVVPDGVAEILGVKVASKSSGIYSYADIIDLVQGLQKYEGGAFPQLFFPSGVFAGALSGKSDSNRHFTSEPLKGSFLPLPTSFNNKSVWNLLNEYLNPAVNEMYTAVKYTPSGRIMPTLVIRQLPFSSPIMTSKYGQKVTSFHELPRWIAPAILIRAMDVGRSDSERVNFVHIDGQPTKPTLAAGIAEQMVNSPPVSDPQDIKRHGLRPHMGHVPCGPTDIVGGGPKEWTNIRADFLLGQHLTLTGVCSMVGVTSPICPGDNFEFDGTLYHIESVHHHCAISADGIKNFTTQLSLTHGVRSDVSADSARIPKKVKVKKRPHLRDDFIKAELEAENEGVFGKRGGNVAFEQALAEKNDGIELEVTEDGRNSEVYLYSGVHDDDNRGADPGFTDDLDAEEPEE